MSKKIVLRGSHQRDKELKTFDIIKSTITCIKLKCGLPKKTMIFFQNQLTISKNDNDTFYIYHMYDSYKDKYSGRWYNGIFNLVKSLNHKNKSLNTKMKFEDEISFKNYDVKIEVFFNDDGWKKILKMIK